jgi:hypothetical protein
MWFKWRGKKALKMKGATHHERPPSAMHLKTEVKPALPVRPGHGHQLCGPVCPINENMVSKLFKGFHLSDDFRFDCLNCNTHSGTSCFDALYVAHSVAYVKLSI